MINTHAIASVDDPAKVFEFLKVHLLNEKPQLVVDSDDEVEVEVEGNRLRISRETKGISFTIDAQNQNMLYFIREAVVDHLAECEPQAAESLLWSEGSLQSELPPNFKVLHLVRKGEPLEGLIRMTLHGDGIADLINDGLHVKLMVPDKIDRKPVWPKVASNGKTVWPRGEDKLQVRYFTLKSIRPELDEVDIDVMKHCGGRVYNWLLNATIGQQLGVMGPGGGLPPPAGKKLFIAADLTALPAVSRILTQLGSSVEGTLVVIGGRELELEEYLPVHNLEVIRLDSEHSDEVLIDSISASIESRAPEFVWFGGEFAIYKRLKKFCAEDYYLDHSAQDIVCYWKRGLIRSAIGHD